MINVRLVSNITKEGSEFTLVSVKVTATDEENAKQAMASKGVNTVFTNVSSLFSAIEQATVDLVQSGLV